MPITRPRMIAVAGKAPYLALLPELRRALAKHSIDVELEEMNVENPNLGFMVDSLEYLAKAGVVAIDIWHPAVQGVAGMTDWMDTATQAGSVDIVTFRDSDSGLPFGHNVAFAAAGRILDGYDALVEGVTALLIGDAVPGRGVREALLNHGVESVTILGSDEPIANPEDFDRAVAAADVVLDLSPSTLRGRAIGAKQTLPGFADEWHAVRLQEILKLVIDEKASAEVSGDLVRVFSDGAGWSVQTDSKTSG